MKKYYLLLSIIALSLIDNLTLLSQIIPYKNFEIKNEKIDKKDFLYKSGSYVYRKKDNVLVSASQLNLKFFGVTTKEKAIKYLNTNWVKFGHTECADLTLKFEERYLSENIIKFNQVYNNLLVDNNQFILGFDKNGLLTCINQKTFPILTPIDINPKITLERVSENLLKHFGCVEFGEKSKIDLIIHISDGKPILSFCCQVKTLQPFGYWLAYVDANTGKILEVYQNQLFDNGTGRVFPIDPISASHGTYGNNGLTNDGDDIDFEPYIKTVDLLDITYSGTEYSLRGPNARILDDVTFQNLYSQSSSFFNFMRSDPEFAAVMCYYFVDKTMRYFKTLTGITTSYLNFDPHTPDDDSPLDRSFYSDNFIHLANGATSTGGANVDHGEDAMVILHETGHYLHHIMVSGGSYLDLNREGQGEGFGDYWAASEANKEKQYKEYEEDYNRIFRWSNWNDLTPSNNSFKRRVNFTDVSYPPPSGTPAYEVSQIFSSVLMKIYNDIGKERADYAVLFGLSLAGHNDLKQWSTANWIYQAAVNQQYDQYELCIIWNHFDRTYNIGITDPNDRRFNGNNNPDPESYAQLYMRDEVDDLGLEWNPSSKDMFLSEDIWVRPTDDDKPYHDNPEYRAGVTDKTNYVYVKVRNLGCSEAINATLHVYWSKASTGLAWPNNWEESYDANNKQISGEIGTSNLANLHIKCGEETIVKLGWIPPNPQDFNDNGKHHYCLYARIVSPYDAMHCTEVSDININVKCNNNIIWKNITVIKVPEYTTDTATVYVRDVLSNVTGSSCLQITDAIMSHYSGTLDNANLSINLRDSLKSIWISGGSQGSGYIYDSETGLFNVTSFPVTFCNMNLTFMKEYFLDIFVEGNGDPKPFAFDLKHYKTSPSGTLVGGERFIYPGVGDQALPRAYSKSSISLEKFIYVSPNPCRDQINIAFKYRVKNLKLSLIDINSNELMRKEIYNLNELNYKLDLSEMKYNGVMFLIVKLDNEEKYLKLIKM